MKPLQSARDFSVTLFICLVAGALLVAAFAPLQWTPLVFICVAVLFFCCRDLPAGQTFWFGMAFGFGQFVVGVSWVYVSLHTYGGMPLWMGSIAVLLFAMILGVFAAFTTWSAARLFPKGGAPRILAMAALWVLFEWLKSWVFTGFPWLELGYSQTPTWLFGLAPIGGVYLVSFAVALLASCLVLLGCYPRKLVSGLTIIGITLLAWYSSHSVWSQDSGAPLQVTIVQPNVPINEKWLSSNRDRIIENLMLLSAKSDAPVEADEKATDLLIWPETALPVYFQQTTAQFWRSLVPPETALLTGIVDNPAPAKSYNAAVLTCAGEQQLYRKRHLVPFGEYLPMRFIFNWLLDYLQLPMSDFSSWRQPQSLSCGPNISIGLSICYEDAFASEMRRYAGAATVLVNISEDAWFGDSLAPHQRLQMAQMRARELSRPLLRSANTGPSVVIDQTGRILARTRQFEAGAISWSIRPQTGETPYKRFGNWIIWLCGALLLLAWASLRRRPAGF